MVQTSAMDCGPASLKALLEGHGVEANYGRLREACRTAVDGTSIDTVEDLLLDMGFRAEQVMVPADHLLQAEAGNLPALVLTRRPDGAAHFVVVWNRLGPFLQVMDPAVGRRWVKAGDFLQEVFIHTTPVAAVDWLEWARTDDFVAPLRRRLRDLKVGRAEAERLVEEAILCGSWERLAALDGATRLVSTVCASGGLGRGNEAAEWVGRLAREGKAGGKDEGADLLFEHFTSVRSDPESDGGLLLTGAVLVRVQGRENGGGELNLDPLPPEVRRALREPPENPGLDLIARLWTAGKRQLPWVLVGLGVASASVVFEGLIFRGLIDGNLFLGLWEQRLAAVVALLVLVSLRCAVRGSIAAACLRIGRQLETRLRMAFLDKVPRLADRFFRSRLSADMAERAHVLHFLRGIPLLGNRLAEYVFTLAAVSGGLVWLVPESAWLVLTAALASVAFPLATQKFLTERDLRVRTHSGGLSRFSLDTLLGLAPIRSHNAERAVERNHEALVVDWVEARYSLLRAALVAEALPAAVGYGLIALLLWRFVGRNGDPGAILLLVYWGLQIPHLGIGIAALVRQFPARRNIFLRLLECLTAPGEESREDDGGGFARGDDSAAGVAIECVDVDVRLAGRPVLQGLNLEVRPGEHLAVVGPSGAGKSTFVGALLGWHKVDGGGIRIDGRPLGPDAVQSLRRVTAWVDPAVRLWNRSLRENLLYGTQGSPRLMEVIETCGVLEMVERGAFDLETPVGEGGTLLSGGEGQRVRLGRAMLRPGIRLVLLDEAFRGLHREERSRLLSAARSWWAGTTLIHVTHDLEECLDFDRVLVFDGGRLVQAGAPGEVAETAGGRFAAMLEDRDQGRNELRRREPWRRIRLDGGICSEKEGERGAI